MPNNSFKVIVANPPWKTESGRGFRSNARWPYTKKGDAFSFPIYLAYTAAFLEREKFDVEVIDAVIKDYDTAAFVSKLKEIKPDFLLLEVSTPSIDIDLETIKAIKKEVNTKLAICGPHATTFSKELIEAHPEIDFVIRGEFESTTTKLAMALRDEEDISKVKGITYLGDKNKATLNIDAPLIENLDEMPFPARHLFDVYAYGKHAVRLDRNVTMLSSRGCPYQCVFCLWPDTMYGHRWRFRSPKNVVDEIELVQKEYGAKELFFDDDTMTIDKQRMQDICDEIISRNIDIKWQCYGHAGNLDLPTLKKMKEAGCYIVRYGVESGNDETLKRIKKGATMDMIRKSFKLTKEAGLRVFGTFMFGLPGDTKEKCEETIRFAIELDPDFLQISIVTPYPGTEMYEELKNEGLIKADGWSNFDGNLKPVYDLPDLTADEMTKMLAKGWRTFYFRPSKIIQILLKIRSWDSFKRTWSGGISVLRGRL